MASMPTFLRMAAALVSLLVSFCLTTNATAQEIRGFVVEASTGDQIASVQVWLQTPEGEDLKLAFTGADGRFTLMPDSSGTYRVEARRQGYDTTTKEALEWNGEAAQTVVLRMPLRPVELEGIEVEASSDIRLEHQATYAGLYRRAENARPVGRERVYLRDELEFDDFRTVTEYVRQRNVPGVGRRGVLMSGGRAPPGGRRAGCEPHVVWVGFEAPIDVTHPRLRHTYLQMRVRDMEAIELYGNAAQAPMGVRPTGPEVSPALCGLIVLWPRRAVDADGGRR